MTDRGALPIAIVFGFSLIACAALPSCRKDAFDETAFVETFKKIHRNIYTIYKLREGDAIYDTLERSCVGEELEREVYEYLKCLRVQDELRTFISIVDVIYNDVRVRSHADGEVEIYCKWIVIGKVRHPTHIHRKVNLNEAVYRVRTGGGEPRIIGYDLLANQAVEAVTR